MRKQLIIVGIIALLIMVGFCGCTNKDYGGDNKFVGTWKDYPQLGNTFTFLSDGTGSWAGSPMTWKIKDEILEIDTESSKTNMTYDFTFSENYKYVYLVYTLKPDVSLTLVKQ